MRISVVEPLAKRKPGLLYRQHCLKQVAFVESLSTVGVPNLVKTIVCAKGLFFCVLHSANVADLVMITNKYGTLLPLI